MTQVSASDVKNLRSQTGAGMMDCKRALGETDGDIEKAIEYLRIKGLASAAKKSGRTASEGTVFSYIHMGGKIGVLLEVNCETDFVARGDDFQGFVKDVAMHVAAASPRWLTIEDVPPESITKEREIIKAQLKELGKPDNMLDKIADGKMRKFAEENCLMAQPFVKDTDKSIETLRTDMVSKIGENIQIRRFTRYVLGEGIEKRKENLAEEIAKTVSAAKS